MRPELKKIKAENAALAQKVQAGRESIAQTEQRISAAVDEWKVRERKKEIYFTGLFLQLLKKSEALKRLSLKM